MYNYKVILLLFFALGFSACQNFFEQVVEVEIPEHTSKLAPTLNFNDSDSTHSVYVGTTLSIIDPLENQDFSNATVALWKDDVMFMPFEYDANGYYTSNNKEVLDSEVYTLKVNAPGFEETVATQTPPAKIEILEVTYEEEGTIDFQGERVDLITINIDDPEGVENFYGIELALYSANGDYIVTNGSTNDPIGENFSANLIFPDKTFDGKNYDFAIYFPDWILYGELERIVIRLSSWSKDKYLFEKSYNAFLNSQDNPFAEPAVVHSNCSSEAGVFSISRVVTHEIIF